MRIQEDYFVNQMVEAELKATMTQEAHEEEKWQLESMNSDLQSRFTRLEARYEKKRLDLLIAEANLMQAEGVTNAQITDLWKQLAAAQYNASMGEEKIKAILNRHKLNILKLVSDSLDRGWKTWLAQATELQILRADKDNRKTQGLGFFKMIEEAISTVHEDIARDLYDMAASHREEIIRLMHEFDKHEIDTSV